MPISWKSKILLAKIETTYGTDSVPTAAANGVLATEVKLTPMEGDDVSRDLDFAFFAAQPTIPSGLYAKLSFKVELVPAGALGVAPAWGPLLRACACAQTIVASTSVTYNPISTALESASIYLWVGGTRYVLLGTRGTVKLTFSAQGIPYLEFEMQGLFAQPTESARTLPTLTAFLKPDLVTKANTPTFTVNAVPLILRQAQLDLGNQLENRFLVGSESVLITDKADMFTFTAEAEALTTINPFSLAAAQTSMVVQLIHGTVVGRKSTLNIPTGQMQRPKGLENAQNIAEWQLGIVPLANAGNDQWNLLLT